MTTFFTADQHFGHANIIRYCNRPDVGVQSMDERLMWAWNQVVRDDDTVYHLGDLVVPPHSWHELKHYVSRLKGIIKLVPGNHDVCDRFSYNKLVSASGSRVEVLDPIHDYVFQYDGAKPSVWPQKIVLSHYHLTDWNQMHLGSWHLFGHSHGRIRPRGKCMDVGVDAIETPISLEKVIEIMRNRDITLDFSWKPLEEGAN